MRQDKILPAPKAKQDPPHSLLLLLHHPPPDPYLMRYNTHDTNNKATGAIFPADTVTSPTTYKHEAMISFPQIAVASH
jgi:hypothetical protein